MRPTREPRDDERCLPRVGEAGVPESLGQPPLLERTCTGPVAIPPGTLTAALAKYNDEHKIVRRNPSEKEVEGWVAEARTLPKVVEH